MNDDPRAADTQADSAATGIGLAAAESQDYDAPPQDKAAEDTPEPSGPAPLNPIAPPEGADERASRSSSHSTRSAPAE